MGEGNRLTSLEVKVKATDTPSPYFYPSRTLEIRVEHSKIVTPIRAATSYEYHAKMKVPTANTLESPLMIDVRRIGAVDLQNLLTKSETYGSMFKGVELNKRLGQYAKLKLTMFQPTTTPYVEKGESKVKKRKKESAMALLKTRATREKFLRFVIKMQMDAQMDLITIPFINLPFTDMCSMVTDIHRNLMKLNQQPLFFVDLKYAAFRPLVELLVDELQSNAVGLLYKPYRDTAPNYDFLRSEYLDRDVAFIATNTNRYDLDFDDVSTMHYLPFFGNDIYAVVRPPSIKPKEAAGGKRTPKTLGLGNIRFFSRSSLKVKPIITSSSPESILNDFDNKDHEVLAPILRNRHEAENDLNKWYALSYLSKVHELSTSLVEFESLRKFIGQSDSKDYVKAKPSLQRVLTQMKTTTLNGLL